MEHTNNRFRLNRKLTLCTSIVYYFVLCHWLYMTAVWWLIHLAESIWRLVNSNYDQTCVYLIAWKMLLYHIVLIVAIRLILFFVLLQHAVLFSLTSALPSLACLLFGHWTDSKCPLIGITLCKMSTQRPGVHTVHQQGGLGWEWT